jgi:diguanylate cyclase (GGDEF)-like protein/PAS domain S-box-containing protein
MDEIPDGSSVDTSWAWRILGQLADVVFVLGLDGLVEWRRELTPGASGAPDDAVQGHPMLDRVHPDEIGKIAALFDDLVTGRRSRVDAQVRVRSAAADGSWLLSDVAALRLPDGRVVGLSKLVDGEPVDTTDPESPGFSIADVTPVGIALLGLADLVVYTNDAFRLATNLEPGPLPVTDEIAGAVARAAATARRAGTGKVEVSTPARDLIIRTHRLGGPKRPEVLVTIQDITELQHLRASQRQAERILSTAFEHAPGGMALVGLDGRFLRVNPAFAEITGYGIDDLLEIGFPAITHPDDLEADMAQLKRVVSGQIRSYRIEKRYLRSDGHTVWCELRVAGAYDDRGELTYFISQINDITARKALEEQQRAHEAALVHRATHDPLTDLPNRALLLEHLRLITARARRTDTHSTVLFLDLDGFKAVNDTHGHATGDRLLVTTAGRLKGSLRESDVVARIGGDEFVIVLADVDPAEGPRPAAERVHAAVTEPIDDPEVGTLAVGASIGMTAVRSDDEPLDPVHRADGLAYDAKRAGGGIRGDLGC